MTTNYVPQQKVFLFETFSTFIALEFPNDFPVLRSHMGSQATLLSNFTDDTNWRIGHHYQVTTGIDIEMIIIIKGKYYINSQL